MAIFIKQTAVVFKVPEKFTISSCAARDANLFDDGLKGSFVILLISLMIFLSKFFLVFNPVPTAVPPVLKNKFLLMQSQFLKYIYLIANDNQKILAPKSME